ncbi:MAG TPA: hypothetical protein VFT82_01185 [Candidatus Paceibacterota bacterium]|nr:hypothetical protein [Candidatus Paceibacterota bacterium]
MSHKNFLRELAKFASGLVAADFIVGAWLRGSNMPPVTILWTAWTPSLVSWWMVFDVLLFAVLVHYAWRAEIHSPSISHKTYFVIVGLITGAVSVIHLVRIITGFGAVVNNWAVPLWVSWIGFLVTAFVSYASFRFAKTARN